MSIKQGICKRCGGSFFGDKDEDLCGHCEKPQPATIHDEAAEKVELAKTYAEDGAFASAARIYREIAGMYQHRADEIAAELDEAMRQQEAGAFGKAEHDERMGVKPDDGSEDGGDWMNGDT